MHPCDQGVISALGVDDQVQLSGSTSLRSPAHLHLPRRTSKLAAHHQVAVLVRSGFDLSLFISLVMDLYRVCFD